MNRISDVVRNGSRRLFRSGRALAVTGAVAGSALTASVASAQAPQMAAVPEVIEYASIATAVSAAGVAILLLVFGYRIGFGVVWSLLGKMSRAIR